SGAGPCDDPDMKEALCAKKPITFAGTTWEQIFSFDRSGLDQVVLFKEDIDPEDLVAVFQVLGAENSIVAIDNGLFDLFDMARAVGVKEALDMGRQLLITALLDGSSLEAYLFPTTYVRRLLREKAGSAFTSLQNAPADLRVIQLLLEDDGIALSFSTPVQFIRKLGKKRPMRERF
ncbi:MAG: hypothetical protein K2G99_01710, partial [Desulfovibrio sp.]|nr:hypothetical protein [Desulfovibrio sp.]